MKNIISGCVMLALLLGFAMNASALEIPTDITVRNLNGVQECIKTFSVSPEIDAAELIEQPFEYNGYSYSYTGMVKSENAVGETKIHRETITVETKKKDLNVILAALEPTKEYDDGTFYGVLNLDHTSIKTEVAGYQSGSYTVTDVKEIGNLNSNDMSYVPSTTVKNGVTLKLSNVSWKVQSSDLVDDVLVPASYVAVATYSGTAWYSTPTGYITTAEYVGEVSSSAIGSIIYTLTYTGTPLVIETPEPEPEPNSEPKPESTAESPIESVVEPAPVVKEPDTRQNEGEETNIPIWMWITGGALLLIIAFGVILIIVVRKRGAHELRYYETEERDYHDE